MAGQVRITSQQQLAYVPHTSVSGEAWQLIKAGTTTANGAGAGTTIIDTNADSGAADTYSGRYWVHIRDGQTNGDLWKRIVGDDGSGTLTLENNGFPAQVASDVDYEIWLSPEPVVVVDVGGATTTFDDDVRDEADDFWIDYYAVPISGNNRGEIQKITAFDQAGGVEDGLFTCDAFTNVFDPGDVILLRKFVEVGDPSNGITRGYEPRLQVRSDFARGDGRITVRGGTFGFSTDVIGSGVEAVIGANTGASEVNGLFQACGFVEYVADSKRVDDPGAANTTTSILLDTASIDNLRHGMGVSYNGNISFIDAVTDGGVGADTITISPPLPDIPVDNARIHVARLYELDTSAEALGVTLEWEVDGERLTMTGCKGNVSLNDGAKMVWAFEFNVDHWVREIEAAPYSASTAYTTAKSILNSERLFWVDATKAEVAGFTASLNTEVSPRNVQGDKGINGRCGYQINNYAAGATWRELLDTSDELTAHQRHGARGTHEVIAVFGTHGDAIGVRMPKARYVEDALTEDQDGQRAAPNVVRAHDAGSKTHTTGTTRKDPDFSISIF